MLGQHLGVVSQQLRPKSTTVDGEQLVELEGFGFRPLKNPILRQCVGIANGAVAVSTGIASASAVPFPANIAAIAAGVAAVIAALSAFATGGIVGGSGASTTMGDNTLIRVNRGEMVLNNRQQARLFKMLDGGLSLNTTSTGGTVDFRISGSNLYGSLKNYSSMAKKHGKITGIS